MVAANCLIGFVTYMYLTVLAPNYLVPFLGTAGAAAVVCVGLFLLFNILFNYWACVLTRPGWPGHHLQPEELYPSEEQAGVSRFKKTCRRCTTPKPPRCHHCSVARSKCRLGSAELLLGARLAAPGGSRHPGREAGLLGVQPLP